MYFEMLPTVPHFLFIQTKVHIAVHCASHPYPCHPSDDSQGVLRSEPGDSLDVPLGA